MVDFGALFNDRNFINLLAGAGAGLDPEGVGGALGKATQNYIRSLATQEAVGKENDRKLQWSEMLRRLMSGEGLTPNTQEGPEKLTMSPDKATLDITMPGASTIISGGDETTPPTGFGFGSSMPNLPAKSALSKPKGYNLSDIVPFF